MTEVVKEGWYADPEHRHEWRWFSQGAPTDLVMDNHQTSRDPISVTDPAAYADMDLAQPPDDGRLLHKDPPPARLELWIDHYGAGVRNIASDDPYRPGD